MARRQQIERLPYSCACNDGGLGVASETCSFAAAYACISTEAIAQQEYVCCYWSRLMLTRTRTSQASSFLAPTGTAFLGSVPLSRRFPGRGRQHRPGVRGYVLPGDTAAHSECRTGADSRSAGSQAEAIGNTVVISRPFIYC